MIFFEGLVESLETYRNPEKRDVAARVDFGSLRLACSTKQEKRGACRTNGKRGKHVFFSVSSRQARNERKSRCTSLVWHDSRACSVVEEHSRRAGKIRGLLKVELFDKRGTFSRACAPAVAARGIRNFFSDSKISTTARRATTHLEKTAKQKTGVNFERPPPKKNTNTFCI